MAASAGEGADAHSVPAAPAVPVRAEIRALLEAYVAAIRTPGRARLRPLKRIGPDARFIANPLSPELQRMALIAAVAALLASCSSMPSGRPSSGTAPRGAPVVTSAETRQCLGDLGRARVSYAVLPDQRFAGGCSQIGSVAISSIDLSATTRGGQALTLTNLGPVTCPLARNFAGWVQYGAARAAEQMLGSPLVRIETFGSYSCRAIAGTGRLSEHGRANAIDVAAFVLADGRRVSVKQGWRGSANERIFLRTVHDSACKRFGTVLSPDYNAAHADHLHFDMSGQGYCR